MLPDRATAPAPRPESEVVPQPSPAEPLRPHESDAVILYLVPRFPVLSQTFVLTEWSHMRRSFRTELASLFA